MKAKSSTKTEKTPSKQIVRRKAIKVLQSITKKMTEARNDFVRNQTPNWRNH